MLLKYPQIADEAVSLTSRRGFIHAGMIAMSAAFAWPHSISSYPSNKFRAIAFDAFPIFDPRSPYEMASMLSHDKGNEFAIQWRTTQFEYTWLRAAGGQYKDFLAITEDALTFAAKKTGVELSTADKKKLMAQFLTLNTWPDVIPALEKFKQQNLRLCFLSNMTSDMLISNMKHCNIEKYFEEIISTDTAHTYKPDPRGYALGTQILKLKKEEILFVAFAGWDACGAKWFGYPSFWLNRSRASDEELSVQPDGSSFSMDGLLHFVLQGSA
jgi:2-haloacid dehalogenase